MISINQRTRLEAGKLFDERMARAKRTLGAAARLPATGTLPPLGVIVLAAGLSSRLGQPKPLARVQGATLLARMIATVARFGGPAPGWPSSGGPSSGGPPAVLVITPPRASRYLRAAPNSTAKFIPNPARASGLSSSVRLGLRHARYCAGVLLIPVDLVDVTRRDIARLVSRWRGARRRVVASSIQGSAAPPMIVPRCFFEQARGLQGDQGLRQVVRRLPADRLVLLAMPAAASDIDTPSDLSRARRRTRAAP